jgi:hypothetical protein
MSADRVVRSAALFLLLLAALPAAAQQSVPEDSAPEPRSGFIFVPPSAWYDNWVFLLQGYYSGLDGFGLGIEATRPFEVPLLSKYADSDIELKFAGRLYEDMHGEFELNADASFSEMRWSIRTLLAHSTRLREFWGVGPELSNEGREKYRPRNLRFYVEGLRSIGRLRIGLRFEVHDYQYLELAEGGLLESGEFIGVSSTGESVAGGGLTWDYDSRDDRYAPTSGWRVRGNLMGFNVVTSGRSGFLNTSLDVRNYQATSPHNVFAFQAFTFAVNADAPIWRYAAVGGREHTRGYSRNRYLDQRLLAGQIEWRRHLYRRLGLQVFGGSALVAPSWGKLQVRYHRPTIGAGLSIVIPQVSNTAIRGDLALGDESIHGRFALGLAF